MWYLCSPCNHHLMKSHWVAPRYSIGDTHIYMWHSLYKASSVTIGVWLWPEWVGGVHGLFSAWFVATLLSGVVGYTFITSGEVFLGGIISCSLLGRGDKSGELYDSSTLLFSTRGSSDTCETWGGLCTCTSAWLAALEVYLSYWDYVLLQDLSSCSSSYCVYPPWLKER